MSYGYLVERYFGQTFTSEALYILRLYLWQPRSNHAAEIGFSFT